MLRKIKIKVKHLVYIVMGLFTAIFFLLPNTLFIYAKAMEKDNIETSKVFYKRYVDLFPFGSRRAEALYNLAQEILPSDRFDGRYKIYTTGFSSGSDVVTAEMVENAVNYYKEIIDKHKDSEYSVKAYNNMIDAYNKAGIFEESEKIIENGINSDREDIRLTALKHKMLRLLIEKQYSDGIKIGEKLIEEGEADPDIYMLMGDISFYNRNLDDALKYYEKTEEITKWQRGGKTEKFEINYNADAYPDDKIRLINKIKGGYSGDSSIHGTVYINGKPAPFVYVYLKNEKEDDINAIGDENRKINAITDFKGEYVIPSLPEGDYVLGVGVPMAYLSNTNFQTPNEGFFHLDKGEEKEYDFTFVPPMKLIKPSGTVVPKDGKVDVEWDKVEGAAYYYVRLIAFEDPGKPNGGGSYAGFSAGDKITGTRFTVDINKINMESKGFMMNDEGILNPQAYLGVFYPGSTVPFYIEAFDKNGRLIKSSVPMKLNFKDMTVISMPQEGLTEGDRLVLERKPEEAIKAYEEYLKQNPDDVHTMMVLSKIYSIGTKRKFEPGKKDRVEGRNIERARELLKRLYEITGDIYYAKAPLGIYFVEDISEYKWALDEYAKVPESGLDGEDFARIASLNLGIGNYREADKYYERLYNVYKDTNYYDLAPVIIRLYFKDYEGSLKFLKILDLHLYKVDKDKLIEDINRLKEIDRDTADYAKFEEALKAVLSYRLNKDYRSKYREIYGDVKEPVLSEILKSVGNYYHVFEQ